MNIRKTLMCVLSALYLLPLAAQAGPPSGPQDPSRRVKVGDVESLTLEESLPLVGSLEPERSAVLMSRIDGVLTQLVVEIGDRVKAGQVLARVSAPELEAEGRILDSAIKQARVGVAKAQAKLPVEEANLAVAKAELAAHHFLVVLEQGNERLEQINLVRVRLLAERGSATQAELEQAEAAQARAAALLESVRSRTVVLQAQVGVVQARIAAWGVDVELASDMHWSAQEALVVHQARMDLAVLRAPFDGVVTKRYLDSGAPIAMNKSRILQLMDTTSLRLAVLVPESAVAQVRVGNLLEARMDAYPGRVIRGQVARIAGALDPSTRTLRIEVEFDNAGGELLPGMYARATLVIQSRTNAAVISGDALWVAPDGSTYVMVLEDGIARRRPVEVGLDNGIRVEIRAGLKPGETVILGRPTGLSDGDPVAPVKKMGVGR